MGENVLRTLSDEDLLARLDALARQERELGASIVAHLVEVERRRLHLEYGYASLFKYCVEKLGFTEDMAYRRMKAAKAAASHPEVIGHLESGELSLSTVRTIAPHLDRFGAELVEAARGMSDREAKRLVAELVAQPVASYCKVQPVAGGKVKIEMVVDAEVAEALDEAVALDRHIDPSGDRCALLGRMTRSYLKQRRKERFAQTDKPRSKRPETGDRNLARRTVPAQVTREVLERDGERCSHVGPDGTRCTEREFLETDHRQAVAMGGRADDVSQVRILCRAHNQYAAEKTFGVQYMDDRRTRARKPEPDPELKQAAEDVTSALHTMGFTKAVSRKAVECAMKRAPTTDLAALLCSSLQATERLR